MTVHRSHLKGEPVESHFPSNPRLDGNVVENANGTGPRNRKGYQAQPTSGAEDEIFTAGRPQP